ARRPSLWGPPPAPRGFRPRAAYPGASDGPPCSLLGLAPGGACRAGPVTRSAGELLPHRFTLTGGEPPAVFSLWRFPRVAPPGSYPAPCPVESGLSSREARKEPPRGRPAGSSTSQRVYALVRCHP